MSPDDRRFEADAYSPSHLPMAKSHPPQRARARLYAFGAAAMVIVGLTFLADTFLGRATLVSNGPLSESHALFGRECAACHTPGEGVPDAKCASCHEKAGDPLGIYGFARHYLYRSADFDRSAPSTQEVPCASCHVEHGGRATTLQRVADARCQACHDIDSFASGHPDFDFAAERIADADGLRFTHVQHVREIFDEEELSRIEPACLRCHVPEPSGRFFQPISFARDCDACHLTSSTATPLLPIAGADATPGVQTVATVRDERTAAAAAADYWDPNEFRERDGQVQKRPVYHEDPWVVYNLGRLRRQLYPGAELADLLRASADVPPGQARVLQEEAVATLRSRIQVLRGEPARAVQDELKRLEELLDAIEARWIDPFAPADPTRFDVRVADRAAALETGELDEGAFLDVVDSLTAPCQSCHVVEHATITRVQKDQRTLIRFEFDHRAHIIHAQCLDCHTTIPVRDWLDRDEDPSAALDRAAIQNLPTIETCRSCHERTGAPAECASCHLFHPDKAHWSNLSRYRQGAR
jgi:hypothetical protein